MGRAAAAGGAAAAFSESGEREALAPPPQAVSLLVRRVDDFKDHDDAVSWSNSVGVWVATVRSSVTGGYGRG